MKPIAPLTGAITVSLVLKSTLERCGVKDHFGAIMGRKPLCLSTQFQAEGIGFRAAASIVKKRLSGNAQGQLSQLEQRIIGRTIQRSTRNLSRSRKVVKHRAPENYASTRADCPTPHRRDIAVRLLQ
jgi:hypothetical protein